MTPNQQFHRGVAVFATGSSGFIASLANFEQWLRISVLLITLIGGLVALLAKRGRKKYRRQWTDDE